MFTLAGVIAWFTGAMDASDVTLSEDINTKLQGECQTKGNEECQDEDMLSTVNMTPEYIECSTIVNEMASDQAVDFHHLRISDSEDWDEEIAGMQHGDTSFRNTSIEHAGYSNVQQTTEEQERFGNKHPKQLCHESITRNSWEDPSHKQPSVVEQDNQCEYTKTMLPALQCHNSKGTAIASDNLVSYTENDSRRTKPRNVTVYEDYQFDWDYMEKLNELTTAFSSLEKEDFLIKLRHVLESVPSSYSFLLYLIENYYSNVIEGKKSMAHVALSTFQKWYSGGEPFCMTEPTDMEKDRALWIVTTRKLYLFDLCHKVFKLDSKGNEYLQKHIYYLLESKKRYKEAVTIAHKLHLQPCFQPKEILLPLIILNKVQLAESYIADCPYQQRAFVSMLDKLCVMPDESLEELANEIIPLKPQSCKITQASLTKLGERLVKKFQLDPEDFPELFRAKNRNGLAYLLHQRQKDKGKSTKKWDDLIERCVGNNLTLQHSLVELLLEHAKHDEAQMWARYYQLPSAKVSKNGTEPEEPVNRHEGVQNENWDVEIEVNKDNYGRWHRRRSSENIRSENVVENEFLGEAKPNYLKLTIPMERIFFIDDDKSLSLCQRAVSKPGEIVGFDAEWKPQMCQAGLVQRLSIMQLSLRHQVFILDVIEIAEQVSESAVYSFGDALFANEAVLKLGYGVESDFKALIATLPALEKCIKKMKGFVDLCTLSQKIFEVPTMQRRIQERTKSLTSFGHLSEKGLSLLAQQCLGLPLDKTYQLSDWEQRPLLEKQVIYAALDARCLLDVFDTLRKWMKEENIEVDLRECLPRLPGILPKQTRKPKGKVPKHPKPGSSNCDLERLNQPALAGAANSPQNFRVVVDNMLQGLGRYLRCCGADVVMLANEDGHEKAAKIAQNEGRVLLTTGTPYYTLRSQVPLGQCMCVPAGSAKQQVLAVFKHFNVSVKTSDIFSRCQACNGNEYVTVSSVVMRQAYMKYHDNEYDLNKTETSMQNRFLLYKTPAPSSSLDVNTMLLRSGVKLQIAYLPESILDKVGLFYCCATCGKIFWEGGHFSRICTQFSDVLRNSETIYETTRNTDAASEQRLEK